MIVPQAMVAPSGRIYMRHPSGMGVVMVYFELNRIKYVLILDSNFRSHESLFRNHVPIGNNQLPHNNSFDEFTELGFYFRNLEGTHIIRGKHIDAIPDSWIDENVLRDSYSSEENCDIILNKSSILTSDAINHCRKIRIGNRGCSLPNIQLMARIYADSKTIDSMDSSLLVSDGNRRRGLASTFLYPGMTYYHQFLTAWTSSFQNRRNQTCFFVTYNSMEYNYPFYITEGEPPRGINFGESKLVIPILEL